MLWTLILVIFPSHCAWNQSPRSLTSLSNQTFLMLTSRFHFDNKITKPATCSKFASGIVITKGANQLVYFNKATLPGIDPIYENPNTYPYGWTTDIAKYSCRLGLNLIDINQCAEIEEAFIYSTIYDPCCDDLSSHLTLSSIPLSPLFVLQPLSLSTLGHHMG